jgi:hypothetical protein
MPPAGKPADCSVWKSPLLDVAEVQRRIGRGVNLTEVEPDGGRGRLRFQNDRRCGSGYDRGDPFWEVVPYRSPISF